MPYRLLALVLVLGVMTACSGKKDGMDGADGYYGDGADSYGYGEDGRIRSGVLADLVPGSQEELNELVGNLVYYGFNSTRLSDNAHQTLARQAEWLNTNPTVTITIEGHADERGTREYNLALGERRADAARNYLVSLGVSTDRISIISYGKERPAYPGSNEVAWSKNRRAVTVVN